MFQIATKVKTVTFEQDETVFMEGDIGLTFYIVAMGKLAVYKETGRGQRELKRLGFGDFFGEMALITQGRRSGTVRALIETTCIEVTQSVFMELMERDHYFAKRIMTILSTRLQQSDEKASSELLNAHQALIFSLSQLAESRDDSTGAHIYRVRDYCTLLAQFLSICPKFAEQVTPVFIENLYIVSPLHDIGKVAIPDNVLLKEGRLTPEEYELMKTHTTVGAKSLAQAFEYCPNDTFAMAYNIVLHHHEWYDGSGYPFGLAKDAIPLEARILAIADVYDALLSKRCYKSPFTYQAAIDEMKKMAASQFDPDMLGIMMEEIGEFENIHQKYFRVET